MVHGYVPAEHERLVCRGQRIHADDMAEQRVSVIVWRVADEWKPRMAGYHDVLDFAEPAHAKDSPLAANMKSLQTIEVWKTSFLSPQSP